MVKMPVVSGRDVVRVLERIGYQVDRQRGSHIVMRHHKPPFRRITIPDHGEVAKGTLRAILRQAGLSSAEMVVLLK
jgi:predicted RNA binding protein YcfA (HicA-like mRNA interferase family)